MKAYVQCQLLPPQIDPTAIFDVANNSATLVVLVECSGYLFL
jgi:hypothetical protein